MFENLPKVLTDHHTEQINQVDPIFRHHMVLQGKTTPQVEHIDQKIDIMQIIHRLQDRVTRKLS